MSSNIAVKITADTTQLTAQLAVASAQSRAFTAEMTNLAKQVVAAGGATPELNAQLQQVATQSIAAKAKVADLREELGQSKSSFTQLTGTVGEAREMLAGFGVALGIGEIIEFGKSVFEAAEQVYHEAEVLSLSTTAYQAFAEGGKLAGVSVDVIDTALRKFNLSQGQAATGTGLQAKAFNDLGVSAKLPAEDALPAVARALLAIEDPARRSRDEVALFGKAGEELNPLLETWAGGIDNLTEKLSGLGLIMSPEVTKAAHDAKVAMDTAWGQVDVAVAPAIIKVTQLITGMVDAYRSAYAAGDQIGELFDRISGKTTPGVVHRDMDAGTVAGSSGTPKVLGSDAEGPTPTPRPNFTDDADAKKAATQARQIADETAQAYEQAALKHIESEERANSFLVEMGQETIDKWKDQAVDYENSRYAAEVAYIKKKEAADAGDKVKEAQDQAQEAQLYQEHTDRLTTIDQQYAQKKKAEDEADLQLFIRNAEAQLQSDQKALEDQYKNHQINAQQRHDQEIMATQTVEAEVLKRLNAEIAGLAVGTAAYQAAVKQREEAEKQFSKDIQATNNALVDEQMAKWKTLASSMESSINSALNNMILHGGSFGNFMTSVADSVAEAFLEMGEKWIEQQIMDALLGPAIAKPAAVSQIGANAAVAGSAAFASTVAIPVIGPEMAPGAAAAAYAGAMSYEGLVSLDVGTNYVPNDMLAMIHQGERVIPAADNSALMGAINGGGAGGGDNYTINISAVDAQSVQRLFSQNGSALVSALAAQKRGLNPFFNGART